MGMAMGIDVCADMCVDNVLDIALSDAEKSSSDLAMLPKQALPKIARWSTGLGTR